MLLSRLVNDNHDAEYRMAKQSGKPKGRKAAKVEPDIKTIGVRASREWAEWLEEVARHYRTNVSGVIDRAMAEWTQTQGYPKKPPERTP